MIVKYTKQAFVNFFMKPFVLNNVIIKQKYLLILYLTYRYIRRA